MKILTSWDDGKKTDLKLARLLKEYNIPAIFFIPSNCELCEEEIKSLFDMGFEIGGHTVNHYQDMKLLNDYQLKYEIEANKDWLEGIVGKKIKAFCYPRGRYNEKVIDVVKKAGFEWARTTKVLQKLTDGVCDPMEIHTSIHAYPFRPEYKGEDWVKLAKYYFLLAKEEGDIFHLWGHSLEVDKNLQWENLEKVFKFIKENK